jgi:hypothetical protein
MAEKDTVFESKVKYKGIFNFKDFYEFCHGWLVEEKGFELIEKEYSEKLNGPVKNIDVKWQATKKITDYFKFEVNIEFKILAMSEVEINQGGAKIKTNKGEVSLKVKGVLIRDYDGKFESSARMKLWRGIYEKWIIASRIDQFEEVLIGICDGFLSQAKAFLDLESKP